MTDRFTKAIDAFDAYHKQDPNLEIFNGQAFPKELLYAQRMTERLASYAPAAEEYVKLAARSQHIGRWEIPRQKYPMDKKGYLQWRNEEKIRHAKIAAEILLQLGYENEIIEKVKLLLLKKELATNPATQLLEDVVCLVFVEYYLEEFAAKHDDVKVIDILRKTIKKMSPAALNEVGRLTISGKIKTLIQLAIS
jgi:hypothetical protein